MDISVDALERALPRDTNDQNEVLKKLVLTLRQKLSSTQEEMKSLQHQLCNACNQLKHNNNNNNTQQDNVAKKDLAAALAKIASIQADYDALTAHFEKLRDGYKRVLEHIENQKLEIDELRTRNSQLSLQTEKALTNQLKIEELTQKINSLHNEKSLLEKDLAQHFAAALDSAGKLEILKKESAVNLNELTQNNTSLTTQNAQFKTQFNQLNLQNQELRNELQKIYTITSVESISDLAEEITNLKNQNAEKDQELQILAEKIVQERQNSVIAVQTQIAELRQENTNQLAVYQNSHQNELQNQKQLHEEEIQNLKIENQNLHSDFMSEHAKIQQLIDQKEKFERQLETEKQIYDKAKQRAMGRYNHVADQLEKINQVKDEYEGRMQELQVEISNLQNQLIEARNQNKMYNNNYDDIFLRAGQQQVNVQQLDMIQQQNLQNNSLTKTIIDRLANKQQYQVEENVVKQSSEQAVVQKETDQQVDNVVAKENVLKLPQIVDDEEINLLNESSEDDVIPTLQQFEIAYSDMQLNQMLSGEYSLFISFFTKEFLSIPQKASDDELVVEFEGELTFKLPMLQETLNWIGKGDLVLKLMKKTENGLEEFETVKMSVKGLLNNQDVSDEVQFKCGSLNIQVSKI